MKKFYINQYKENPERKLRIRHYRKDQPEKWKIDEAQITLGNRIMIETPETGYSTAKYELLNEAFDLRDEDGNLVGHLEFEHLRFTLEEFALKAFYLEPRR